MNIHIHVPEKMLVNSYRWYLVNKAKKLIFCYRSIQILHVGVEMLILCIEYPDIKTIPLQICFVDRMPNVLKTKAQYFDNVALDMINIGIFLQLHVYTNYSGGYDISVNTE
jgi:hypothetical protein